MKMLYVILSILGSTSFFAFVQFLIQRHDKKKGVVAELIRTIKELKDDVDVLKTDMLRTQLMDMIHIHPEDVSDIMDLAEEYFVKVNGNWYMSSVFKEWLIEHDIEEPIWMKK